MDYTLLNAIRTGDRRIARSWADSVYTSLKSVLTDTTSGNSSFENEFRKGTLEEQIGYVTAAADALGNLKHYQPHANKLRELGANYAGSMFDMMEARYSHLERLAGLEEFQSPEIQADISRFQELFPALKQGLTPFLNAYKKAERSDSDNKLIKAYTAFLGAFSKLLPLEELKFQFQLGIKVKEYAEKLDELYHGFFSLMVDTSIENIRAGRVSADGNEFVRERIETKPMAELFLGIVPSDTSNGYQPFIDVMKRYDKVLYKASDLYKEVKDTFLNTESLWNLLVEHFIISNGRVEGGKSGDMRIVFFMMQDLPRFVNVTTGKPL